MLKAGEYTAKIADYGMTMKGEMPQAWVKFEADGDSITWYGGFKEGKVREITIKTLLTMGFDKTKNVEDMVDGVLSGALDISKDYYITVITESFQGRDGETKTATKVKWVNASKKEGKTPESVDKAKLKSLLGGVAQEVVRIQTGAPKIKNYAPGAN